VIEPPIKKEIALYNLDPNFLGGLLSGPIEPDEVLDAPLDARMSPVDAAILKATVDTLRHLAYCGGVGDGAYTREELHALADLVATGRFDDWGCCPVCEETWCDGDCPLAPIRGTDPPDYRPVDEPHDRQGVFGLDQIKVRAATACYRTNGIPVHVQPGCRCGRRG